jgi:hypothetical protein
MKNPFQHKKNLPRLVALLEEGTTAFINDHIIQ